MKRLFIIALSVVAFTVLSTSCQKEIPDGEAAIKAISFEKSNNPSLASTVTGKVDEAAKTITFVVPASAGTTNFVATFTVTKDDVVSINGNTVESGVTSCNFSGATIVVSDAISNLKTDYTVKIQSTDEKAELISFVFAKADNSALEEDVVSGEIAPEMIVRVPAAAFQTELKIKVTAGQDDIITIDDQPSADGSAVVDTKFPIDITVTDAIAGVSNSYVVKVGKILDVIWTSLGVFSAGASSAFIDISIDPVNGTPYFSYEKSINDGAYKGGCVAKWDGNAFSVVSEDVSGAGATDFRIAAYDGKPYVFFKDAGASKNTLYSVMSYNGSSWSFTGDRGFCDATAGTSHYKTSFAIDPASKHIFTATAANAANSTTGQIKRGLSIGEFNGTSWDANKPILGRTNYGYTPRLATFSDGLYCLVANQDVKTYSLYKEQASVWSPVVESFIPVAGAGSIGITQLDAACDGNDVLYAAINCNVDGIWLCRVFKNEGDKFVQIGNDIPGATFNDSHSQFALSFDLENNPIVVYNCYDETPAKAVVFNSETKDWGEITSFNGIPESSYLRAAKTTDGKCYVVYPIKENEDAKTYSFALYVYGYEADILPE